MPLVLAAAINDIVQRCQQFLVDSFHQQADALSSRAAAFRFIHASSG